MKSSDLMLGDFVTFKDCLEDGEVIVPIKIIGLGYQARGLEEEALVEIDGDKTCDVIEIDDEIVGIPLTPEILEKNGFEKNKCGLNAICYTLSDDYYALALDEFSDSIWRIEYTNCEMYSPLQRITFSYIHELQHFLKMVGVEKQIEL